MKQFFDPASTSLKVCGVTLAEDAQRLIELGVEAVGVNFWPKSKRYIAPELAHDFLAPLAGKILRVGVFVNAEAEHVIKLLENGTIDVAQFHGDESVEYCQQFKNLGFPFIRGLGVKNADSLNQIHAYGADAILLDAHAPGVYGGTGAAFDWSLARKVIEENPGCPILLAGGITQDNAEQATREVAPAALDLASGSESAPGIKDFDKIAAIQAGMKSALFG